MDKELLGKVQAVLYEMLQDLDAACKALNIPYFLDCGTLLGAIRHDGFIPWDDDIDVGMMREDYERFLKEAPAVLGEKYTVQHWKQDAHYGLAFGKLRKNNTVYLEASARDVSAHCGFYIDIFPYDAYPDDTAARKKQGRAYAFLRRAVLSKCGYRPWEMNATPLKAVAKHIAYLPMILYGACHSKEAMIAAYEKACMAYNDRPTESVYAQAGASNYGQWVMNRSFFAGARTHIFETREFPIPFDAEGYLTSAYGDYLTPPPEDKRENRHRIIKISF